MISNYLRIISGFLARCGALTNSANHKSPDHSSTHVTGSLKYTRHRIRQCTSRRRSQVTRSHHTPSIAFRHLPPDSARFSYATEGALFISAQLSTDLRNWRSNLAPEHARKHVTHPPRVKKEKEFRLDSNDCGLFVLV